MKPKKPATSLRSDLIRSWVIMGTGTIAASFLVVGALFFTEYYNQNARIMDDLKIKAPVIARRLSSELLLGSKGMVDPVLKSLLIEFKIEDIHLAPEGVDCSQASLCTDSLNDSIAAYEKIPYLQNSRYVILSRPKFPFKSAINVSLFLFGTLPLLLLLGAGIFLQWSFLKKRLLKPIGMLLESGTNAVTNEWSTELQYIAEKLKTLLQERDKATEEAHRFKTESLVHDLSQRILHDLKSPLGTLGLMIETDLKDVPVETKDSIRRVLSRIRGIVDFNLKEYSADALSISKAITPSVGEETPSSSIGGAIKTILEEEEPKAKTRSVEIVCDIGRSAFQSFVPVSFSELCRVLSNLISNAVDASDAGGKRVFITTQMSDKTCEILVKDYGKGFSQDGLKLIESGERFTSKQTGTGLGLLTVRGIIQRAGGKLNIQSTPTGSLVRISLPRLDIPNWFFDITRCASEQIVALDDDATIKVRLDQMFPNSSIKVYQTEDEFMRKVTQDTNSLLLVDYDYGGSRNGLDLILSQGLTKRAVLVSGRIAYDPKIRSYAEKHGIRLFPKECLG